MKKNMHPEVKEITVKCDCGNTFKTMSTKTDGIQTEICNMCHPFFTGNANAKQTKGRIDKFNKKFGIEEE